MCDKYVAVIDSGIGGISVLKELVENFPTQKFLYFGDNDNCPYGNKTKRELESLTLKNLTYLLSFNLRAIVVACNTLSVNVIGLIKEYTALPVIGVFPPIERCVINGEKTLLLATVKTAENFKSGHNIDVVGVRNLVSDIEVNVQRLKYFDAISSLHSGYIGNFCSKKGYYDTIILGCTHYNFVKNQISDHFQPRKILSGVDFSINFFKKICPLEKSLVKYCQNQVLFIGNNAENNQKIFNLSGQKGVKF